MAKKKRRTLNYLEQAIADTIGISSRSSMDFKQELDSFIRDSRRLTETLHLEHGAYGTPMITLENREIMKKIIESDTENFAHYLRALIVGDWVQNRVVYTVLPETAAFLRTSFTLPGSTIVAEPILELACRSPVFIDFPKGSPIASAFCGLTRLANQNLSCGANVFASCLVASINYRNGTSRVLINSISDTSLRALMTDEASTSESRAIIEALAYIAFVSNIHDAMGTVLQQHHKWRAKCYDLLPVPEDVSLPDFEDPNSYIAAGFSLKFSYLRREAMLNTMEEELSELPESAMSLTYQSELSDVQITYLINSMVIDAEINRIVYQATGHAIERIYQQHKSDILLFGFPADLLRYFPHKTVVIGEKDSRTCYLISVQKCVDHPDPCIAILSLDEEGASVSILPTISELQGVNADFFTSLLKHQELLTVLCLLYHILYVLKRQSEANLQREPVRNTPMEVSRLTSAQQGSHPDSKPHRGYREGAALESLELFSVTAAAVRRIPTGELQRRFGWKMVPHTRRRHPHRYWVGKGEDRHMEVRWLEEMHINAGQGIEQLPAVKEITV